MQGIYLKELGLNFVKVCLTTYLGQVYFFGFFIAGIFLFIIQKKRAEQYISIYTLFLFVTIFNPFLIKTVYAYFNQDEVYYRFFWLLPVNIIVAYLGTYCIGKNTGYVRKGLMAILILCIILFMGSPAVSPSAFVNIPDNLYKVSDEVLEISEYIRQDTEEKNPRVAVASDLLMVLRQYDASLNFTLNRDFALCWQGAPLFQGHSVNKQYEIQKPIMDVIYGGDTSNPNSFKQAIASTSTQYLIYSKSIDIQSFLQDMGAQYIAETDNYVIFRTAL